MAALLNEPPGMEQLAANANAAGVAAAAAAAAAARLLGAAGAAGHVGVDPITAELLEMIRGQQQVQQQQQQQHHGQEVGALSANLLAERDKRIEVQVELEILKADHAAEAGQQPFFRRAEINFCKVESMELIPTLGDTVMTQKMAETKDTFIMSRTIVTALSQDPPNVELATDLAGQLCRLANNKWALRSPLGPTLTPKRNTLSQICITRRQALQPNGLSWSGCLPRSWRLMLSRGRSS